MTHIRKSHSKIISFLGMIIIATFGIISTLGSGGGGGDGGTTVAPVEYTGLNTQALIDESNAQALGEVAFVGVTTGTSLSLVLGAESVTNDNTFNPLVLTVAKSLYVATNKVDKFTNYDNIPAGVDIPPIYGNCGGSISGTMDVDMSGNFTGNMVFGNYCVDGLTINGTVSVAGLCDPFDPSAYICEIDQITMTFNNLNASGFGESQTMSGTMDFNRTATGYVANLTNVLLRDDLTNITYKYFNYTITVTLDTPTGSDTLVASGDVYHPDYGYVIVSVPDINKVLLYSGTLYGTPYSGEVLLTGANGNEGPTTARFIFSPGDSFVLEIDTNGDGTPDTIWTCSWDTGVCV